MHYTMATPTGKNALEKNSRGEVRAVPAPGGTSRGASNLRCNESEK
jgi:hypothetical protein